MESFFVNLGMLELTRLLNHNPYRLKVLFEKFGYQCNLQSSTASSPPPTLYFEINAE